MTNCAQTKKGMRIQVIPAQQQPGVSSDAFVELIDIFPSLAHVAVFQLPQSGEGESFAGQVNYPSPQLSNHPKKVAFSQYPRMRNGRAGPGGDDR